MCQATPARAQHGDYILGTAGLLAAQQPPEGVAYQNLWSFYHVSGNGFRQTSPIRCGPLGRLCLSANFNASGSLDLFVDQNIFWLITPLKLPIIGATYGFVLDVPFALADTSGAGSLEPVLTFNGLRNSRDVSGSTAASSGGVTKGSIGDLYFEPLNLGWHFQRLDAVATGGFIAPTGPYNANARVNIGYGHWTGLFGLGGILYADAERTWSLSLFTHYEMYASQNGRPYTLGDQLPFEWGAGKTFDLRSGIFQQITLGAVGYAQWQTTDNQIGLTPTSNVQSTLIHRLETSRAHIYAAGPAVQLLTKYGLFGLRYYDEFGASDTPSGRQLMFSVTLAGNPWG
jgi:hypothetical protein